MKIKAIGKKLVIKLDEAPALTKHGIALPSGPPQDIGTVLSVGEDVKYVKVDDRVKLMNMYSDQRISGEECENYYLAEEDSIAGVIQD